MSEYICCDFDLADGVDRRELEQIVRCRDCEMFVKMQKSNRVYCDLNQGGFPEVEPYGFCAWGERRSGA